MTQEEFSTLKPGDKVRIVKEKTGDNWDWDGEMDKWLGKVMTVTSKEEKFAIMEEDKDEWGDSWLWYPEMIECKVEDEPAEAKDKKEDKMRIVDENGFLVDDEYFKEEDESQVKVRVTQSGTGDMQRKEKDLRKRFLTELTGERGPFTWSDFGVEFTQRWDEVSLEMVMEAFDRAMEEE